MTQPTLDCDVAEAIYELVGFYETEKTEESECSCVEAGYPSCAPDLPLPNFSEVTYALPKIGEKIDEAYVESLDDFSSDSMEYFDADKHAKRIAIIYMNAPTATEGMKRVSEYLRSILL